MNFKHLGISDHFISILKKSGITTPTPIQQQSIPAIKEGRDVIAEAQTGTGKTLAFLLPIFEKINPNLNNIQVLIVSPTRELAIQITEEAKQLATVKGVGVLAAYGGQDLHSQFKKLKGSIQIVVATPGRLMDHLRRQTIDLSQLTTLVLDEADEMLLMGFKNEVETIISMTPKKRQTLCFSATMNPAVKKLAYRYMTNPVVITASKEEITLKAIKQFVVETTDRHKQASLFKALEEDNPFMAIIFCRTKRRADTLEIAMKTQGYNFKKLHSDVPQPKRERIMKAFRNAEIQYLIATDVAARGLDVTGVTHIYNYDIPETVESYIHRIGRTGRAGEEGITCVFVDPKNMKQLEAIESTIGFKIPRRQLIL